MRLPWFYSSGTTKVLVHPDAVVHSLVFKFLLFKQFIERKGKGYVHYSIQYVLAKQMLFELGELFRIFVRGDVSSFVCYKPVYKWVSIYVRNIICIW